MVGVDAGGEINNDNNNGDLHRALAAVSTTRFTIATYNSVPWLIGSSEGHEGRFSSGPLLIFSAGDIVGSSGMGRDAHFLMLSIQHFLCQPWCPPPPGALKDSFRESFVARDMCELWEFLFLDCARQRSCKILGLLNLCYRSLPLDNSSNTVVVVGGVHWLATHHLKVVHTALARSVWWDLRL